MPEGHLVHHLARIHARTFVGRPLSVTSPQGRFSREAALLDGGVLTGVEAYGKHLFYAFAEDAIVHVHLGLRGVILLRAKDAAPLPQARVRFNSDEQALDVVAPSVCELGDGELSARVIARLGPDPLRDDVDERLVMDAIRARKAPIGAVLLDQAVVSGIGNVLRAEALHAARLHPSRPARSLSDDEIVSLWRHLVRLMRDGAERGRVLPYLDEDDDPKVVDERKTRAVYRQQSCRVCGSEVERAMVGGREAWACPRCQPRAPAGHTAQDRPHPGR